MPPWEQDLSGEPVMVMQDWREALSSHHRGAGPCRQEQERT